LEQGRAAQIHKQGSAMRRILVMLLFGVVAVLSNAKAPALADEDPLLNVCLTKNPAFTTDDLSGIASPCAAPPGTLIVETLYYQNASRVGGTALAAYPLFRLRTGIVRRLEAVVDAPSQIAESGLHGIGLYPTTHFGYGLNYTIASNSRMASSVGIEAVPPNSRFSVSENQAKYVVDLTAGYHLNARSTLSAIATGASSLTVGLQRIEPAAALRYAYDTGASTQISTDFGARIIARHSVAQSYGDVALNQRLGRNVTLDAGLGTTFNSVSNAKAHYLASGFNLHL
jgi:hypothetical protein